MMREGDAVRRQRLTRKPAEETPDDHIGIDGMGRVAQFWNRA